LKIWKWIFYSGLAVFLCGFLTVAFVFIFNDDGFVFDNPTYINLYEAPKTGAQTVEIFRQDFSGDTTYYVGVRASKSERWRQYHYSVIDKPKIPSWCQEPIESRKWGTWSWEDANIKRLRRNWKY
jgi:hypothetical protein